MTEPLPMAVGERVLGFVRARASEGVITILGETPAAVDVLVPSSWKETVACSLVIHERGVRAEAFFLRAPEENPDRFYRLLLQRNRRSFLWRFAANDEGDTFLTAEIPAAAVDDDTLDRLLGTLVELTDAAYVPAMKLGWERGLADQVARGGPGVDSPPPWAGKPPPGARPGSDQAPPAPS